MKRFITLSMMFVLSLVLAITATGCGNAMTLDKTQLDMFVGESTTLTVKQQGELSWESSDETVAVVSKGGVVTAVGAGTATIKVSNGKKSAECAVKVTDTVNFTLQDETFSICRGYRVLIKTNTTHNNTVVDAGSFTFASDNTAVATVDSDGFVTAIKNGEANVTVTWTYNGQTYSATVKIIVENKVSIYFAEQTDVVRVYGDTERTTKLEPTVKTNYEWVENPTFTWKSMDESIATVDANGVVTGVGLGEVEIVASYTYEGKSYSQAFTVVTSRAVVESGKTYTVGYRTADLVIPAADIVGNVSSVIDNGEELEYEVNADGDLVVYSDNFNAVKTVNLVINTDKAEVKSTLNVITGILMTAEDLDKMDEWGRPENFNTLTLGKTGNLSTYSGAFILGADIDYGGKEFKSEVFVGSGGWRNYSSGAGVYWSGMTFDGQGHIISNIEFDQTDSLFGAWLAGCTVSNLGIVNAKLSGTYSSVLCLNLKGTTVLENIYVEGYSVNETSLTNYSFLAVSKEPSAIIRNVLVNVESYQAPGKMAAIVNSSSNDASIADNIYNTYSIGTPKHITYEHAKDAANPWGYWAPVDGVTGGYANADAFLADRENVFTGDFNKVFKLTVGTAGGTALRFFDTVVKEFGDGHASYQFAIKNQDFIIEKETLDGQLVWITLDGVELPFEINEDGDYVIDKSMFTSAGNYVVKIRTTTGASKRVVRAITATIGSVEEFKMIAAWGKSNAIYELTADLDFKGAMTGLSGELANFYFDGQGHTIKNVGASNGMFGETLTSGEIKNVAITGYKLTGNFQSGLVVTMNGGTIENVYIQGGQTAGTLNSMCVRQYNDGTIKNVIVDFDPMSTVVNTSLITNVVALDAVISGSAGSYKRDQAAQTNGEIPANIYNVYSIGMPSKHIVADNYTSLPKNKWNSYVTVNTAKGAYANDAAFLSDIDNIVTGEFAEIFSYAKNDLDNTVLYFYGTPVKEFADGPISYSFGYKNQDLVLPKADFEGKVSSIKLGAKEVEFTTNAAGDYVISKSNFGSTGFAVVTVTTDKGEFKHNVEIITAYISTAAELDMMDDWGRPAGVDPAKVGTPGNRWTYMGIYRLAADIDYAGNTFHSEVWGYSGAPRNYSAGCGGTWSNLVFDGQGHVISNIKFDSSDSLFGGQAYNSKFSNVGFKNVTLMGASSATLICTLDDGSSIENVFADGIIAKNSAGSASVLTFVCVSKKATATINNVLVNISSYVDDTKIAGIVNFTTNDASVLSTITNAYTIGTLKNITYTHAPDATYKWGYWTPIDGSSGGYAKVSDFMADKDTIFTGDFAKVFSYDVNEKGNTMIYFMGKLVKVYAGETIDYSMGRKAGDLVIDKDDFSSEITSIVCDSKPVAFTKNADGDYVIKSSDLGFAYDGMFCFEITAGGTTDYKNIEVITAYISTAADLDMMDDWGRPANFSAAKLGTSGNLWTYTGTFRLANDIDYGGKEFKTETYVGSGGWRGYTSGCGAYWKNMTFDGQGYAISNIEFGLTDSLFGMWLTDSKVSNLALLHVKLSGTHCMSICNTLKGSTVLENIFVDGYSVNEESLTDYSFLAGYKDATATINNVLVNISSSASNTKMAGIINTANDASILNTVKNAYTIGSLKNIVYTHAPDATYKNGYWTPVDGTAGGYINEAAFFADKDTIFTGDFAKAFSYGTDANGVRVIKFFGKTVKHAVGYKNKDLVLDAAAFGAKDGDTVSITYAGTALTGVTVAGGKITAPKSNFTAVGYGPLTVTVGGNTYCSSLNVVTALIDSVDEFKAISTYGMASGTYLQTKDIDFGNTTAYATSTDALENFNYDGQGYALKDIKGTSWIGIFGKNFKSGTIKNVAITGYNITGNYNAAVVADVSGGTIENVYVHGYVGSANAVAQSSLVSKGYYSGVIKNVVVNYDTTLATASGAYAVTRIMDAEKNADYDIPTGISNVYSIGLSTKHIVANVPTAAHPTWTNFVNLNKATGGYADATGFFGAKATVFTGTFNNAFRLVETDTATTMNFYGREVLALSK